jgi:transposase
MGFEPDLLNGRPCDLSGCAASTDPSVSFRPLRPLHTIPRGGYMRSIALDVHRDFCEVAIKDGAEVRSAGRIKTTPEELGLFARSLAPDDQVALEASGPALQIARVLEPHVGGVVIANTRKVRAIAEAKVKTDTVDARTLCELLAAGFLPEVFGPDEGTRALRRRLARRAALVRQRTRAKNELHAVLARNLKGRPPMSDVFGVRGREWLETLRLPADERETIAGCLRQVDFLDREIDALERELARSALASEEIRRLMSVPGVNLVSAATFVATVGDIARFETPRKLVSYVGLDPRVRQSGEAPARHGHISKQGSAAARHMLCEAAWIVVRAPGPLRAFYERLRARRGAQIALVATARKLCVLFWHLLTREQDYAFGRPSLTRHKLRRLELIAGDPSHRGRRSGSAASKRERAHERELSEQFERAYRRLVENWQQKRTGAGATRGRASRRPSSGQAARQASAPGPAL